MSTDGTDRAERAGPQPSDVPGLLAQYLSNHDAPCPACGYNLRGAVGEKCPECARPIALGIARSGPAAALTWFLLLAFGWVFAAGAMNSFRYAQTMRVYVENSRMWGLPTSGRTVINGQGQTILSTTDFPVSAPDGFWSMAWQMVPAYTWAGAAWSSSLAVGCGIGLLLMARRRARPFAARSERRMIVFACTMFGVYAAWHVTNFLLEFA